MKDKKDTFEKILGRMVMRIALRGGLLLRKAHLSRDRKQFMIERKKTLIDMVTDVDRKSDKAIRELIESAYPDHAIITEEANPKKTGSPYVWYVDPLDGTTNFIHGYPQFAVSIAVEHEGEIVIGCVFNPVSKEIFFARKGHGAMLNGKKISVSQTTRLDESLLVTGFPYDIRSSTGNNFIHWENFVKGAQAVRRDGSAALDLCYVAAGRFDGFWERKLNPWDIAAGLLLVAEAGGRTSDFSGNSASIHSPETLADNGRIHQQMMDILNGKTGDA